MKALLKAGVKAVYFTSQTGSVDHEEIKE